MVARGVKASEARDTQETVGPGQVAAIVVAAGRGERFGGGRNKIFADLSGKPVWWHAAARLRARVEVGTLILVVSAEDQPHWESAEQRRLWEPLEARLVQGGARRSDSVVAGLDAIVDDPASLVAIHDAARPCVPDEDLRAVFREAQKSGAALLARPLSGTIKRVDQSLQILKTVPREGLWEALTPQVFHKRVIFQSYRNADESPNTDDAQIVERAGHLVTVVPGNPQNLKITLPQDLAMAALIQSSESGNQP